MLVSSQLDRGSKPPSPAEGLAKSRSCRSRTCQPRFVDAALGAARQPPVPQARVELASRPSDGQCLEPQDRVTHQSGCSGGVEPAASTFTGSHARLLHHKHHRYLNGTHSQR